MVHVLSSGDPLPLFAKIFLCTLVTPMDWVHGSNQLLLCVQYKVPKNANASRIHVSWIHYLCVFTKMLICTLVTPMGWVHGSNWLFLCTQYKGALDNLNTYVLNTEAQWKYGPMCCSPGPMYFDFTKMYEIWRWQPYFEVWFVPLNSLFSCLYCSSDEALSPDHRERHPPGVYQTGGLNHVFTPKGATSHRPSLPMSYGWLQEV